MQSEKQILKKLINIAQRVHGTTQSRSEILEDLSSISQEELLKIEFFFLGKSNISDEEKQKVWEELSNSQQQ